MKISKRLKCISDMVPKDSKVIDVGCDHGYLSIYLSLEKNCVCLATDVNKNALENAKTNIIKYNAKKVNTLLTDGLDNIKIEKDDYIIIAGMGTSTIISILNEKELSNNLIISSNNQLYDLRKYVTKLGFYIENEVYIEERGKNYIIISFKKGYKKYSKIDLMYGPISKSNTNYLASELEKLIKIKPEVYKGNFITKIKYNLKIKKIKKIIKIVEGK